METTYLKINPADNVAVAITPLKAGETIQIDGQEITLKTDTRKKAPDILLSSVPLQALKDWALHRPTLPPNASRIPISKRWHNLPGCSILIYTSPTSVRDLLPPIY